MNFDTLNTEGRTLTEEEQQQLYYNLTRAFDLLRQVRPLELHEMLGTNLSQESQKYLRQALQKITREIPINSRLEVIYEALISTSYEEYQHWFNTKYAPMIKETFNTSKVSVMSRTSYNSINKNKDLLDFERVERELEREL